MWVVDVGIPFREGYDTFEVADAIEQRLGMAAHAGSGFGYRDMQFDFNTQQQAQDAQNAVLEILRSYGIPAQIEDEVEIRGSAYATKYSETRLT